MGFELFNSNFFKNNNSGFKDIIILHFDQLSTEDVNIIKSAKVNDIFELTGYFEFEFCVKRNCRSLYITSSYKKINKLISFKIIRNSNLAAKMGRLIAEEELKRLYLYRDIKYTQLCGHSLIDTYAELLLTEATPFDIGVFIECDIYKNSNGYITLNDIIRHNPNLEEEVKQSFNNLEKLGYLEMQNKDIVCEDENTQTYEVKKSILKGKFSEYDFDRVTKDKYGLSNYYNTEFKIIQELKEEGYMDQINNRGIIFDK